MCAAKLSEMACFQYTLNVSGLARLHAIYNNLIINNCWLQCVNMPHLDYIKMSILLSVYFCMQHS